MNLSLKNFNTQIPKELLLLASKDVVRECVEITKGNFVAYVDEGTESYDVSLLVDTSKNITGSECDCNNGKLFCRHKVALLLYLVGDKKKATKIKKAKGKNLKP